MANILKFRGGAVKPPAGSIVDPTHPFSRELSFIIPFNDGGIYPLEETAGPAQFTSSLLPIGAPSNVNSVTWGRGVALPTNYWASNSGGRCLSFPETWGVGFIDAKALYVTSDCTVAFVRRKKDTTLRSSSFLSSATVSDPDIFVIYVPHANGNIYWFFGANATPFIISGITVTTLEERWVFTKNGTSSAIWYNGVKLGTSTLLTTRTPTFGGSAIVGNLPALTGSDVQEMNWLQVSATQWSDEECRWWSAEPYAHMIGPEPFKEYFFFGLASGAQPTSYGYLIG